MSYVHFHVCSDIVSINVDLCRGQAYAGEELYYAVEELVFE